ncbi:MULTISPECIES: GntR family transcriptional regulator [unclassified Streptomyces]|uniref:GntR family transcriptional regulator n=1 Tax=unclassified Streptomyces TaxID=2593676 RepID=UPI002DD90796|nr:GntR family transcriptional regulator [Streptomyces sp. NBC_01257]WRZ69624.1 GntR family transcriptional regulator [Streptomyces sp. NBC_01257]WSU63556.1 GntR family transcriptional regulator [Streptomyces sp. NBC_01104]
MTDARSSSTDEANGRAVRARRVADVLRQRIVEGDYESGTLPDERVLGRSLGATRNVVRAALDLLRDEGLVTRRRGIGTLVTARKAGHGLGRLTGLAEELTPYGTVTNEVREARLVQHAPPAVAERLMLPDGSAAVYIERLRHLDGSPLSLDSTWLAPDIGGPLLGLDLAWRDLFALIEENSGVRLGSAEITVHAVTAEPDTAQLLGIPNGSALFAIDRLTRLADGRPVDLESLRVRGDRFALHTVLERA